MQTNNKPCMRGAAHVQSLFWLLKVNAMSLMLEIVERSCQQIKVKSSSFFLETIDQMRNMKYRGLSRMGEAYTRLKVYKMCKQMVRSKLLSNSCLVPIESYQADYQYRGHSVILKPKIRSMEEKTE